MNLLRDNAHRALKRLLANGPLTALPKRPSDQDLLAAMAASRFDPGRTYAESEVNEKLKAWLETFCEPFGVDHVTLRRLLVDARLMSRAKSGSMYQVNVDRTEELDAVRAIEPARVLAEIQAERATRKRLQQG